MSRLQVAEGGHGFQSQRVAANILRDSRSQKTSSHIALNLGEQLATPRRRKPRRYGMFHVTSDFREKWRAVVNMKINFNVPEKMEKNFFHYQKVLTS